MGQISMSKKNAPSVSLLVPIYNAAPFLPSCLASIGAQKDVTLEVLCLDDASTDESATIAADWVAQSSARHLIRHRINRGYGALLNEGLQRARGRYIGIIEADDFADPPMIARLCTLGEKFAAEIIKSDYFLQTRRGARRQYLLPAHQTPALLEKTQVDQLLIQPASIWSALYRRDFLLSQKIACLDLPRHRFQDTSFAFKALTTAKRIVYTPEAFYHYRQHAGQSITSQEFQNAIFKEYQAIEDFGRARRLFPAWRAPFTLAKLRGYKWNAGRLPMPAACAFARLARDDWTAMCATGLFDNQLFAPAEKLDYFLAQNAPTLFVAKAKLARWKMEREY